MSMYNLVFGSEGPSQRANVLLGLLGFTDLGQLGRFRDCWVEKNADGPPVIAVYTRNGGGNRECYDSECDGACTGCIATRVLPSHPRYLRDRDDDFDCTYATFYFRAPDEFVDVLREFAVDPVDMSQWWQKAIDAIGGAS